MTERRRPLAWLFPALLAWAGTALSQPVPAPPGIDDLLRRPEFSDVRLSPRGDYLALTAPMEDRSVLVIMRRADRTITTSVNPGADAFIDGVSWIGDERVVVAWSRRFGRLDEPWAMPGLHTVDVHGRGRDQLWGDIVDPMLGTPGRVLMGQCARDTSKGCMTRLSEVSVASRGKPRHVVDGPVPNARFMVGRGGTPVFSWATDEDGWHQLFLHRDGDWVPLNHERDSGVVVSPLAVADDGTHGWLWSERRSGPDVIERIDLASGARSVLASDPDLDPQGVVASFDRREIVGVRYGHGAPELRWFEPEHPHVPMYRLLEREFPGEAVYVTSATADGRLAVVRVTSDREPGRYYLLDIVSGAMQPLVEHRSWLDRRALAAQQPIRFDRRDGAGWLDGYLTRPLRPAAGGAPLVVLVHGGPHGVRDAWGFDPEVQMLAAHGYAVLQVNFRGSAGRGVDFVESGYRQWGRGMIDDIVDGVRQAQALDGISPTRACIWGASYGGYAALMATVREPDLFACAIGMAGPYDLPTMYRWGDVQRSRWGRARLEDYIGRDTATLAADSPSHHADSIRAALLIVQGGRDRRVSPEHMRIMTRALDRAGKPYELYAPRDETHGFHNDAYAREYYRRVFDFLGRHLPAEQPIR